MGILGFKVALCFAYLRIMKSSTHTLYKTITWIVMITCIIGHVAGMLVLIFQCKPIRKSWRPLTPGKCMPNDATFYGLAAVTIFFDVVIFFLPIPLLSRLNINIKKKFALVCVFLLGLLTTVCSIMRMNQIITIAKTGNSTMLVLWGVIELNIGVRTPTSPLIYPYPKSLPPSPTDNPDLHPHPRSPIPLLARHNQRPLHALQIRRSEIRPLEPRFPPLPPSLRPIGLRQIRRGHEGHGF